MTQAEYLLLAQKIAEGNATNEELALYNASFEAFQKTAQNFDGLDLAAMQSQSLANIRHITQPEAPVRVLWPRIAVAASIIIMLFAGGYFLLHKPAINTSGQQLANDVAPGKNQAVLTLANGKKIVLSDTTSGTLATQGNMSIVTASAGELTYQQNGRSVNQTTLYNTISTPVSGQHEVTLSDGTKVMLDANSSITFPVAFDSKERKITMTGQAYFAVHHNAAQPFRVIVKGQTVEDLGTEFNINAYDDEPGLKTTLVSGSLRVNHKVLQPGEQAILSDNQLTIQPADLETVTAWKYGNFTFHSENLEAAMRQLGRWYNIKIVYEHAPKDLRIGGDISRKRNLSVVLGAIGRTGRVKFRIEDHTVYVSQ